VISPHGREGDALHTCAAWGDLPGYARVAVVCPQGHGARLARDSWGAPGQIRDLARMPSIVAHALPGLRFARDRTYAVGASMGGQEVLLLDARYPRLLAGVVAIDAVTDLAMRYQDMGRLANGRGVKALMRREVGGRPEDVPAAYAARSPLHFAGRLARSRASIGIWWSSHDWTVSNQALHQSGRLVKVLAASHPCSEVYQRYGHWSHSWVFLHETYEPLVFFGLLQQRGLPAPAGHGDVVAVGGPRPAPLSHCLAAAPARAVPGV
jgi:pimeloyl-ACP methyl ester carboxylesterase